MSTPRKRSDTIGGLGRSPARREPPPPPRPPIDPPAERYGIRKFIHGALFENLGLKFLSMVLLLDLNEEEADVPHRPARLYKFNFDKYEQRKKRYLGIGF